MVFSGSFTGMCRAVKNFSAWGHIPTEAELYLLVSAFMLETGVLIIVYFVARFSHFFLVSVGDFSV